MIDSYGAARNRSSARRGDRMRIEIRADPCNAANFDSGRIPMGRAWDEPELRLPDWHGSQTRLQSGRLAQAHPTSRHSYRSFLNLV
ncbi:MAG: hypothetical protein AAGJ81_00455 [Verrucomicrobiota bacterium]